MGPDTKREHFRIVLVLIAAGVGFGIHSGRADAGEDAARAARDARLRDIPAGNDTGAVDERPPQEPGILTLDKALELTLMHSPELAAFSHGTSAAEADAHQAGARPNPELALEVEEFAGTGSRKGFDAAETSVRLSQTLELGEKRARRQRVAQAEARLAGRDCEAMRLAVLTLARKAYVDVLLAQGQVALADSQVAIARDVCKAVTERVSAGKVAPREQTKADVELAGARIAHDRAQRELQAARRRLCSSWGSATPAFKEAAGDLDTIRDLPLEEVSSRLDDAPDVARWNDEVARSREALALAKAGRIPDLGVSAGISRFEEDGTHAAVAGLSLPLPLFDRNAAGIRAATHRCARAEWERSAARLRARTDLAEASNRLEAARAEATTIKAELLPGARLAFDSAETGYREGKFSHLDVLDAQRTLNEAKNRHLEVLADYHRAAADVEQLTGVSLNSLQ